MTKVSRPIVSWVALIVAVLIAALLWFLDNETLLRSTRPTYAWVTVAIMWIEIAALIAGLTWRYRRRRSGHGITIGVAVGAAVVNAVGAMLLLPAIVVG
jgi:quinol-cytochrome oxidoreductase complex cytochrome b subunit